MSISIRNTYQFFDAAGRPFNPEGVVYTTEDMKGLYRDAIANGHPPNSDIVQYEWGPPSLGLCAFIRNRETKEITLYGMNVSTGIPYRIPTPEGEPPPRPTRKRPRLSREAKLEQMSRRWQDR